MAIFDDLVRDTVEICSVATPTGNEADARLIAARLRETGVSVETDGAGNAMVEILVEAGLPCLALYALAVIGSTRIHPPCCFPGNSACQCSNVEGSDAITPSLLSRRCAWCSSLHPTASEGRCPCCRSS